MSEPRLSVSAPKHVRGVALVLHGGRVDSFAPVRLGQLAVIRMLPFVSTLRRAGRRHGLAVARLQFTFRGWNGELASPVTDTTWALDELRRRYPDIPIALVGHSMGGRTALRVAGHPGVEAVVALAPWLPPGEPYRQLAGRALLIIHGLRDRITSPKGSASFARMAEGVPRRLSYLSIADDGHGMLHHPRLWQDTAAEFVMAALQLGPEQSNSLREPNIGQSLAASNQWVAR